MRRILAPLLVLAGTVMALHRAWTVITGTAEDDIDRELREMVEAGA